MMARRMMRKHHVRCRAGEKVEITSKPYLSLSVLVQEALGKCPKCGGDVVKGKYGAYCKNKCGMNVGRAMGTVLSDMQIKSMLDGKKTYKCDYGMLCFNRCCKIIDI